MTYEIREQTQAWVCDRQVFWASGIRHSDEQWMTNPERWWRVRGFWVPLENGLVVSTQWGTGNYCVNYDLWPHHNGFSETSPSAELAVWWDKPVKTDLLYWPSEDPEYAESVLPYFLAECWWELIDRLSRVPTGEPISDRASIKEMVLRDLPTN